MRKNFLAALLTMASIHDSPNRPEPEIQTDNEGVKAYLLKQSKLSEKNKLSKRKQKKSIGK